MTRKNFWDRLFPPKRDFYSMLAVQAKATDIGVKHLNSWLNSRSNDDYQLLIRQVKEADDSRLKMESELFAAFATPFDRQDIYSLSVEMDKIVEYAKSTLMEMEAFEVFCDQPIIKMVNQLGLGTEQLVDAIGKLKEDPMKTQEPIAIIRTVQMSIEEEYLDGMTQIFKNPDLLQAMKYREVYHHIKDAGLHLGYTTDVLHRVVVRLV